LKHNIQLLRDAIVLFTSTGAARGVSGHTGQYICFIGLCMGQISILILAEIYPSLPIGGAYDTVPELCILLSLFEASDKYHPVVFDEAGL
jgi:hypothetical protein